MTPSLPSALLDTDTLSAVMKQQFTALARARAYLTDHRCFTFSIVTRYEILRGLHAKNATTQLAAFERLCNVSAVLPITDAIVVRAAMIYADLYQRGVLIGDGDILIAATALEHGLMVITNNESHLRRITGIQLENWLA